MTKIGPHNPAVHFDDGATPSTANTVQSHDAASRPSGSESRKRKISAFHEGLDALPEAPGRKRLRTRASHGAEDMTPMQKSDPDNAVSSRTRGREMGGASGGVVARRSMRRVSVHDLLHREDSEAPSVASLIGEEKARDLDLRFGSLQPVREKRVGEGIHPWERDASGMPLLHERRAVIGHANAAFPERTDTVAHRTALRHAVDLDALKAGTKRYIWAVGRFGRVIIAEERPVAASAVKTKPAKAGKAPKAADKAEPQYAGHPVLVGGGPARVSGELHYDAEHDRLIVLDKSGRYSRYEDRQDAQVDNVALALKDAFSAEGLDVVARKVTGKAPEPLVFPTLA